jgi:DedD protein
MEQHLKERLVGAVVLTTLAIIIIPVILSGSPSLDRSSEQDENAGLVESDAELQPFNSKIVPLESVTTLNSLATTPAVTPKTTPELPKPKLKPKPAPKPSTVKVPTTPKKSIKSVAKSKPIKPAVGPTQSAKIVAKTGDWLVQLGSFSNARNAINLKDRLSKKAFPVFTRTSRTDSGEVTRVFVGPSASRQQAVKIAARLFTETRLKGMVIRQP